MISDTALPTSAWPSASERLSEEDGGLNLGALARALLRNWWVIAGVTAATTALAALKVLSEQPVYTSGFEVLVQAQSTETEVISNVPETLTALDEDVVDGDLLKILTGPQVLQPVVEGIKERYPDFCPPVVTADEVLETAFDPCYQVLAQRLNVNALAQDSEIIRVTLRDEDPQLTQVVLALVSRAYLAYSLESKQTDIRRGIEFVEQKLPDLRSEVNSLQDQLQALRISSDLIDPESRGGQLSGQVGAFSQQQLELEIQLAQNRAVYENLQQQLAGSQEQASSSALAQNPRYQSLLNSLLELDAQIAEASTIYLDSSPDMAVLKEQRQNLLVLLEQQGEQSQREVISQLQELEARDQSLRRTLAGLSEDVDELAGISRQYTDIQRELAIATENLNQFLAKRAALEIDAAQREIPWEIITPPTEPVAQLPSMLQNLVLGGTLGLLLGSAVALLLDKTTGVIYSDEDIQRALQLNILGRIPTPTVPTATPTKSTKRLGRGAAAQNGNGGVATLPDNIDTYAEDPFMEAFRSLYTNLRLSSIDRPLKSVAVSSVAAGDGKTVTAIHLAEAAALLGQRVLLVDTNLRDPKVHSYLKLPNERGLIELALSSAESLPLNNFLHEPVSGLKVLCAGAQRHDPGRILTSNRVRRIIEHLKTKFDLVVFDTPALLGQSDAYLVAEQVDGLLLVTQPGKLKQSLLDQAMTQIRIANVNVLGIATREG